MFYNKKPINKYRETTYEKEERQWFGASCPVCGKPLSKQRPVCFACPIYPAEYYERKQKERQDKQI
jgi:uncharacterized OB-fold protein